MKLVTPISKYIIILIICCILFPTILPAQQEFPSLEEFAKLVVDVQANKDAFDQDFVVKNAASCICELQIDDERKGDRETFLFNLADLSVQSINYTTSKYHVYIEAETKGREDLIRVTENGKIQGYQDDLIIYASGLEEAKVLNEQLKELVRSCDEQVAELYQKQILPDHISALRYLTKHISEVIVNSNRYVQEFSFQESQPWLVTYQLTDIDKGKSYLYSWNTEDIDLESLEINTRKELILIELEIKGKEDYIRVQENGELENYTDNVIIVAPDIEEARRWISAYKSLGLGKQARTNPLLKVENSDHLNGLMSFLAKNVGTVTINSDAYAQNFSFNPELPQLITFESTESGKGKQMKYRWNMGDLDAGDIDFTTRGKEVHLEVKTHNKQTYIQEIEEGEISDYVHNLIIQAPGIEEVRVWVNVMKQAISLSNQKNQNPFDRRFGSPDYENAWSFSMESVKTVQMSGRTYRQSIERDQSNPCYITFRLDDVDKSDDFLFKFNLEDIRPESINIDAKRETLFIELACGDNSDCIEEIENGEREDFVDEIAIRCDDIEQAKGLRASLTFLTQTCHQ